METNQRVKKPSRGSAAKKQSIFKKRRSGVKELDRLARISAGAAKNLADGKARYFNLICITHELKMKKKIQRYHLNLSGQIGKTRAWNKRYKCWRYSAQWVLSEAKLQLR